MLGRGKSSLRLSFSMMLAQEILRAELQKLYGDGIKFFRCDMAATKVTLTQKSHQNTLTDHEQEYFEKGSTFDCMKERYIEITALVGPLDSLTSLPEDLRRKLAKVEAILRLFTTESGCIWWRPHFLRLSIWGESGSVVKPATVIYESGILGMQHYLANSQNPCQDMCDSQTGANYANLHHEMKHVD